MVEPTSTAIGVRMRELRLAAGLTQQAVADRTGMLRPIVARLEAGRHVQTLDSIVRYASAVGRSPLDVLVALDPSWRPEASHA